MGHSTGHSITDLYIANYPLERQFEYNNKLLNLGNEAELTLDKISKMSGREAKELLMQLLLKGQK